jgi:hypothetical protein
MANETSQTWEQIINESTAVEILKRVIHNHTVEFGRDHIVFKFERAELNELFDHCLKHERKQMIAAMCAAWSQQSQSNTVAR